MRRLTAALVAALLVSSCNSTTPATTEAQPGADPTASVAQVIGEVCRRDAQGSGVVIDDGLVLTSAHAIAGSEGGLQVRRPEQQPVAARLVGFDSNRDLALLAADVGGEPATIGTADTDTRGVIGTMNVEGVLELIEFEVDRLITANSGDIYDEGQVSRSALQLSAKTLPGDSGGALFDSANRVVGIVFAQSRGDVPVAYAVSMDEVAAFLAEVDPATEANSGRCR